MNRKESNKQQKYLVCVAFYNLQRSFIYILLILRTADSITNMPILEMKKPEATYPRWQEGYGMI